MKMYLNQDVFLQLEFYKQLRKEYKLGKGLEILAS